MREIVQIDGEDSAVLTNDILKICVNLMMHGNEYLCTVPKLHDYFF